MWIIEAISNYVVANKLETFAAATGLVCVWLNTRANAWGWFFGILSVTPYIYVFYESGFYGEMLLHGLYLILNIFGWYNWLRGGRAGTELPISRIPYKELSVVLSIAALGTVVSAYIFSQYEDASFPYLDGFAMSFSLAGQWMLMRKQIENWIIWIVVDVLYVFMFFQKGLYVTCGLYVIFLALCIKGLYEWNKSMQVVKKDRH
ncbi:MAG: nicotinamide mononucleotide transporter [Bernardetiaceae bacterium]|nr:nicotinamide mononucleotide transporter [Bernardetiaceae bacterium]